MFWKTQHRPWVSVSTFSMVFYMKTHLPPTSWTFCCSGLRYGTGSSAESKDTYDKSDN